AAFNSSNTVLSSFILFLIVLFCPVDGPSGCVFWLIFLRTQFVPRFLVSQLLIHVLVFSTVRAHLSVLSLYFCHDYLLVLPNYDRANIYVPTNKPADN